jgi:hypothetical protein
MHRPDGKTLLELAATCHSTTDRLHFGVRHEYYHHTTLHIILCMHAQYKFLQDIELEAGLASGLIANHAAAKTTDTDSDIPVCILVKLSRKQPKKLHRLQYKAILKHNGIPEDILTKLHIRPMPKKKGQQT